MDPRPSSFSEEPGDQLLIAKTETVGLARVQGRGSYKISPSLKEVAGKLLEEGRLQFVVDVSACEGMDSTFMGTLAGISQRYQKAGGQPVAMTGVSSKLEQLMKTLGLDRIVRIQESSWKSTDGVKEEALPADTQDSGSLEAAEHILEAHETLVQIAPENLSRFEDCLTYLREDVRKRQA